MFLNSGFPGSGLPQDGVESPWELEKVGFQTPEGLELEGPTDSKYFSKHLEECVLGKVRVK